MSEQTAQTEPRYARFEFKVAEKLLRDPAFDVGAFAASYAREQASKLLARPT